MHGALPASSKAPSVAKSVKPSRSSSKASEQQVPKVFDVVSKPASIASSTTTVAKGPVCSSKIHRKRTSGKPAALDRSQQRLLVGRRLVLERMSQLQVVGETSTKPKLRLSRWQEHHRNKRLRQFLQAAGAHKVQQLFGSVVSVEVRD